MRVYELARDLGVTTSELLALLAEQGGPMSASANVDGDAESLARARLAEQGSAAPAPAPPIEAAAQAEADPEEVPDRRSLDRLVQRVFEDRKAAGRPDWDRVSVAVLKNKLLDLTERRFDEKNYGAASMTALLRQVPVVRLDEAVRPAIAVLTTRSSEQPQPATAQPAPGPRTRIRQDLWRSVMDYSADSPYVLRNGYAVPLPHGDSADGPLLPTISREELADWRREFAERHMEDATGEDAERLATWRDRGLATPLLPIALQGPWNDELKQRTVARLTAWYAERGLDAPLDLLEPAAARVGPPTARQPDASTATPLRQLVTHVVAAMTVEELEELRLPPAAVLRSGALRPSHGT